MDLHFAGLCPAAREDLVPRIRRRDVSATGHFALLVLRSGVPYPWCNGKFGARGKLRSMGAEPPAGFRGRHRRRLLEMTVGARFQGVHPPKKVMTQNHSPPFLPSLPPPLPDKGVATGVYVYNNMPPKSVQVNFLWGKNDIKFYTSQKNL